MIPRYNRPIIENIWTLENKFKIWTEIEILIAEKLSDIGVIPKIAAKEIRKKSNDNIRWCSWWRIRKSWSPNE